jgi:hypothetical protein
MPHVLGARGFEGAELDVLAGNTDLGVEVPRRPEAHATVAGGTAAQRHFGVVGEDLERRTMAAERRQWGRRRGEKFQWRLSVHGFSFLQRAGAIGILCSALYVTFLHFFPFDGGF